MPEAFWEQLVWGLASGGGGINCFALRTNSLGLTEMPEDSQPVFPAVCGRSHQIAFLIQLKAHLSLDLWHVHSVESQEIPREQR